MSVSQQVLYHSLEALNVTQIFLSGNQKSSTYTKVSKNGLKPGEVIF